MKNVDSFQVDYHSNTLHIYHEMYRARPSIAQGIHLDHCVRTQNKSQV